MRSSRLWFSGLAVLMALGIFMLPTSIELPQYNIALSNRRAHTVRDYLISRGIPAQRMRTVAYGKERPVAVCNDISCWSQNRRAVTVLNASS